MKKIVLKSESCIGCGACIGIDSEHFEFSDDGFSIIKSQENLESTSLQDAIDACPVAIISLENISDADTKEKEANEVVDEPIETEKECECHECDTSSCHHCNCHDEKKAT